MLKKKGWWLIGMLVVGAGVALFAWQYLQKEDLPKEFASGNGRIEATEIDIATKVAGRVETILVDEGDFVTTDQVLAKMDTDILEAQKKEAEASLLKARNAVKTARSRVSQRLGEEGAAQAVVQQRQAEVVAAEKRLQRSESLVVEQAIAEQQVDDDRAVFLGTRAQLHAARANVKAAEAAIGTARSQVIEAESNVEAAQATLERIEAEIKDSVLKAPRDGRVQYRVAQPGEVLGSGGNVLNMIDLADVYMTFFLPTAQAGRVAIGTDVRLILDAAPQYLVPAKITFVADTAQFTPKTVETASERQKLMFRVKAQISPEILKKYITNVKTGLPGMAYVRLDPHAAWPPELQGKLLQ